MDDVAVKLSTVERIAAVVQLLSKAPRTRKELAELLGMADVDPIIHYLRALEAEGLIEQKGRRAAMGPSGRRSGPGAMEYRWVKHEQA